QERLLVRPEQHAAVVLVAGLEVLAADPELEVGLLVPRLRRARDLRPPEGREVPDEEVRGPLLPDADRGPAGLLREGRAGRRERQGRAEQHSAHLAVHHRPSSASSRTRALNASTSMGAAAPRAPGCATRAPSATPSLMPSSSVELASSAT